MEQKPKRKKYCQCRFIWLAELILILAVNKVIFYQQKDEVLAVVGPRLFV